MNSGAFKMLLNLAGLALGLLLAFKLALPQPPPDALYEEMAAGRLIMAEGRLPAQDPFYFSTGESAPYPKEAWLFSVGAWALHKAGGTTVLGFARGALLLFIFIALVAAGFRRGANPFSSALFAVWALWSLGPWSALSPALASFLLFAFCLYLMEGVFWEALFARWIWLAPLAVFWSNLSGAALILIPFSLAWGLAEKSSQQGRPSLPGLSLGFVLTAVGACVFLHPSLGRMPREFLEFAPSTVFEPGAFEGLRPGLFMLAASLVSLAGGSMVPGGEASRGRDLSLFLLLALPALLWRGLLPYALLFSAPMAARRLDLCLDAMGSAIVPLRSAARLALLAGAGFFLAQGSPAARRLENARPKETLEFFRSQISFGNVFTDYAFAGYTLFRLENGAKIFGGKRLRGGPAGDYAQIMAAPAGQPRAPWEKALERSGADYALLVPGTPLAKAMGLSREWQPLDFDDASVLYARVQPLAAALIKTHAPRGLRPGDPDEPFDESRLPQVEADLEARLNLRPKSGVLHFYEARLWLKRGREALARQWLEKGIKADPGYASNYRLLGELRLKAGDREGARAFLDKAAALGLR